MKNARYTAGELYRGVFISATVKQLQEFVPELQRSDVTRCVLTVQAIRLATLRIIHWIIHCLHIMDVYFLTDR
jgi:hypothetical protein